MIRNRRRFARQVVNSPVYVSLGSSSGILYDLGEGGLAVDVVGSALGHELVPLGFALPDSGQHIEGNARVAWADGAGPRVGLGFVDLPVSSRQQIKRWLSVRVTPGAPEESVAVQPQPSESPRAPSPRDAGLVTDLRSALFQTVEVPEPKRKPLISPEEAARIQQRRRTAILAGISVCLAGLAVVAGVAFFRSNRAQFVAEFGEFKKQITGIFGMSDAAPASKSVARPVAKSQRRHNEAKSQSATSSELAAKTDDPAKPAKPFEIEVVGPEGQRHLVKPRGSTRLRVQFQGPSWAPGSVNAPGGGSGVAAAASARPASPSAARELRPEPGSISRETSGDVPTQQVMPAYPLLALQKNVQGRVVLQVTVGKDGSVQNVRLLSGHPILATAVVDAVKLWRYKPTYRDGESVEVDRRITVDFVISTD